MEVIIAVGYRVKSLRGTQFRIWATERLREYLTKDFAMDDARLKQAGGGVYFEELLARIRDIRSSERVFWRKVLDIYATSFDYDPNAESSLLFFKIVQNKMHWAVHGQMAAEVIHGRTDASRPNMGLTTCDGDRPRKTDVSIAKNYLNQDEVLNRVVTAYLEFGELQAPKRKPMTMADWIATLDDFLKLSDRWKNRAGFATLASYFVQVGVEMADSTRNRGRIAGDLDFLFRDASSRVGGALADAADGFFHARHLAP